jgi:outer membrane lipoprotein SlyB
MPKEYLTTVETARRRVERTRSKDEVPTTESVGDPDEDAPEASGQAGAAAGALLGTAVAGPVGTAIGAAVGGAAGSVTETADPDGPSTRDQGRKEHQLEQWGERR